MMAQGNSLSFRQPLREVRLVALAAADPMEPKIREREESAYERGRRDAEKALQEQLVQEQKKFEALKNGVLQSMQQSVPKVVRQCEHVLTELCMEAARKLVSNIPISAEMVEGAVKEAMSQVDEATEYEVYLHTEDLGLLKGSGSQLVMQNGNGPKVFLHSSPEVTRGGCLVKTRFGIIDGRRETRFELLKKTVLS